MGSGLIQTTAQLRAKIGTGVAQSSASNVSIERFNECQSLPDVTLQRFHYKRRIKREQSCCAQHRFLPLQRFNTLTIQRFNEAYDFFPIQRFNESLARQSLGNGGTLQSHSMIVVC